ncbi:MAG: hypothetical protein HYU75_14520 [Betaproteobacteria bacterium]|nr:hypothetical protein [Betaproteobacteria bacterium]
MTIRLPLLLAAVIAATFAGGAGAIPTVAAVEKTPGAYPLDCEKAKDKARCADLNRKIAACRGKTDDAWRECMYPPAPAASFTPPTPRDCSQARSMDVCMAHARALEACKDKPTRAEHRNCVAGHLQASLKNN